MSLPKVLIAEDDAGIRTLLLTALRSEPLEIHAVEHGLDALRLAVKDEYAVILLDMMMPHLNGFDFLDGMRRAVPRSRSIVFVITALDESLVRLPARQVHAIIRKPFDITQLVMMIRESALAWNVETTRLAALEKPLGGATTAAIRPA